MSYKIIDEVTNVLSDEEKYRVFKWVWDQATDACLRSVEKNGVIKAEDTYEAWQETQKHL